MLNLLRIGILDYKSQLDIVNCSLGIVPTRFFFTMKRVVSLVFLGHHIIVLFAFPLCMICLIIV